MGNIWSRKNDKPLLVLAPMAGYTDSAFRQLCRGYGADVVMTELVSADAIAYGKLKVTHLCHPERAERVEGSIKIQQKDSSVSPQNDRRVVEGKNHATAEILSFSEAERPIIVQLFGKCPEKFAKAAQWVSEELKPDGIDINMGCPARKVVGSDHGAALLKNHSLAIEIVNAVKENTDLPVSVKTRLGWERDDEILEFAPKLVEAGISAIILHGRTYKDGFKGSARWKNIYKIKSEILNPKSEITASGGIPSNCGINSKTKKPNSKLIAVIGNGDIRSYEEAIERADNGPIKLDGVAIGRASFGNPGIFGVRNLKADSCKLKALIMKHAELAWEMKGTRGIIELRKHLSAYLAGINHAKVLRSEAVRVKTINDVRVLISKISEISKS